jgi:hypothetical protein
MSRETFRVLVTTPQTNDSNCDPSDVMFHRVVHYGQGASKAVLGYTEAHGHLELRGLFTEPKKVE